MLSSLPIEKWRALCGELVLSSLSIDSRILIARRTHLNAQSRCLYFPEIIVLSQEYARLGSLTNFSECFLLLSEIWKHRIFTKSIVTSQMSFPQAPGPIWNSVPTLVVKHKKEKFEPEPVSVQLSPKKFHVTQHANVVSSFRIEIKWLNYDHDLWPFWVGRYSKRSLWCNHILSSNSFIDDQFT